MSKARTDIPSIAEKDGRQHARMMYQLLGHELCGLTELRALGDQGPWTAQVDNVTSFIELAMERNRRGDHVYVGLQPRPIGLPRDELNVWRPARGGANGNVARAEDIEFVTMAALDIDVNTPVRRSGHPASDEEIEACVEVAQRILKLEGFVGTAAVALSGNGVYVINPITSVEVDSGTASALKALERRWIAKVGPLPAGVRIDPILDLPRIIRVIGTVNYKGTPVDGRPHRRSCFLLSPMTGGRQHIVAEQLLYMTPAAPHRNSNRRQPARQLVRGDLDRFASCEFVQWVSREAASIPEPGWMDLLVQAAWLEAGDRLAHEISARDPQRYSCDETQARLDRIRSVGYRPKHCERLAGRDGEFRCPRSRTCPAERPIDLAATKPR